jgi:hypothetical protein
MIRAKTLADLSGVQHRFFTRQGGVSAGLYSSLNCGYGSGDQPDNVRENRRRAAASFDRPADELLTVHQIHSTEVIAVGQERWTSPGAPKADALVTDRPGVVLGVLAADCAPVLLADPEARVVAAAHAGWRGALGGIVEATLDRMEALDAKRVRIRAGIGPCIAQSSYEVGPEFPQQFLAHDPANAAYFAPALRSGHFMFDLPGYIERRLARAGIATVDRAGHDTVAEDTQFFSYRRACLRGEPVYGRALSAIALRN